VVVAVMTSDGYWSALAVLWAFLLLSLPVAAVLGFVQVFRERRRARKSRDDASGDRDERAD
jgi:hypothetical protein